MKKIYSRPKYLKKVPMHYCPGCGHSIVTRLIAELIEEMDLAEKAICIPPAGCAVLTYNYLDIDSVESAHGRGGAMATAMKRILPDCLIFTYQGDGDLAAIGTAETIHAANRGERFTTIFINNAVYGMTGGQMAPTTLFNQKTTTSPFGRDMRREGAPIKISEMLALLDGVAYIERTTVNSVSAIKKTKKAIRKAFQIQMDDIGFSLVEVLSPCPTNWKMKPLDACKWIDEVMSKEYPLGVIKDITEKEGVKEAVNAD
ncbi:MAG: 2-oxoglutarate oxidoreductase [Deltaproteobacteria bacterium]|uniref:2-oxoglutarate oxidoreductase n=1 Tax=Candidatus Zymogenus saltonus TaxID=2844893 RepID=A0A9D8PJ92_9DELT|nr:2-oxoglutarate oxidoreductase [Candidatus Zymogenus saltonus]